LLDGVVLMPWFVSSFVPLFWSFMKSNILKILVGFALALAPPLQAGDSAEKLVREALEKNPELNSYRAEIAAAKGSLKTAGTIRNPELSTQAGYKNARANSGGGSGEGATFALSANQTFEYPGRIALRKAIARGDIELAELHLEQFRITLAARVRALVYGGFIAEEKLAAVREVADRFEALSDVLAQREPTGVTPALEARIIEGNALTLRRQQREAALAARTPLVQLNQLCGRPVTAASKLTSARVVFTEPHPLRGLLDRAHVNAFEIRIREAELAQQGFKVSLSKNERYPAITVGTFYSYEKAADREQQAGVGISLPLPFWDRNAGNIETGKAREQQAQASLLTTQRDIERRVAESAAIFQAKREEIDKWEADTSQKFREAAESADRNYRLGAVPISIYVETQKQYLEVSGALLDIKKDALQAAQELEILTGLKLYQGEQRP
jgi:cobalt-zinc-cadmium efflux system outer membrane protein